MLVNDLHNKCRVADAFAAATITTGTEDGIIVDTANFEACEFVLQSGTITDGTFTVTLVEGDATFLVTDDDTVKRTGYIGKKRYVRLKIVAAGASSGGPFAAMAILAFGAHQPVANQ
jgi:uncharacterized protein (DUF1684 family)